MEDEVDKLNEAIEFFESDDLIELFDYIQDDLKFECDFELTQIFDMVEEKNIDVSLEDIIKATIKRVVVAIESFKE